MTTLPALQRAPDDAAPPPADTGAPSLAPPTDAYGWSRVLTAGRWSVDQRQWPDDAPTEWWVTGPGIPSTLATQYASARAAIRACRTLATDDERLDV